MILLRVEIYHVSDDHYQASLWARHEMLEHMEHPGITDGETQGLLKKKPNGTLGLVKYTIGKA